jgi:hypothetical protein
MENKPSALKPGTQPQSQPPFNWSTQYSFLCTLLSHCRLSSCVVCVAAGLFVVFVWVWVFFCACVVYPSLHSPPPKKPKNARHNPNTNQQNPLCFRCGAPADRGPWHFSSSTSETRAAIPPPPPCTRGVGGQTLVTTTTVTPDNPRRCAYGLPFGCTRRRPPSRR